MTLPRRFRRISIHAPELSDTSHGQRARVRRGERIFLPSELTIPPVSFGDTDPKAIPGIASEDIWTSGAVPVEEVFAIELSDAVVHPPFGIITLGDYVINETLGHIPFHLPGYGIDDEYVHFPMAQSELSLQRGLHAMGGNYANYFHWMLEIVPRLRIYPFSVSLTNDVVLVPPVKTRAQADIIALLNSTKNPILAMGEFSAARVQSLIFVPNLAGFGYAPNPYLGAFFQRIKHLLKIDATPSKKIYITRRDSTNRILRNEADVQALVAEHGFEVIELTGLSIDQQAQVFASAAKIIAPHGAGLTNLIFCGKDTSLCELHSSAYLNPCFRRLAAVQKVRYGCLIGETHLDSSNEDWMHSKQWTLPLDRLSVLIREI